MGNTYVLVPSQLLHYYLRIHGSVRQHWAPGNPIDFISLSNSIMGIVSRNA